MVPFSSSPRTDTELDREATTYESMKMGRKGRYVHPELDGKQTWILLRCD